MGKRFTQKDLLALQQKGMVVNYGGKNGDKTVVPGLQFNAPEAPRETKYRNQKTDGFDSKKEANRYKELLLREKGREITAIQCQVVFQLSICKYKADFVYMVIATGAWVVEDVKGLRTKEYILKRKMMLNELNIKIVEI